MQDDGFVPLFDGKTLHGWEHVDNDAGWSVKDGAIDCDGAGQGRNWIRTQRPYADFVLRLEFAIGDGGNSGVFVRSQLDGRPAYNGFEMQILGDHGMPASPKSTGALYDAVAPAHNVAKRAWEWQDVEITCVGPRIAIVLNSERIVDVNCDEHDLLVNRPRQGYIGLQNHHTPVKFRNVRVSELAG